MLCSIYPVFHTHLPHISFRHSIARFICPYNRGNYDLLWCQKHHTQHHFHRNGKNLRKKSRALAECSKEWHVTMTDCTVDKPVLGAQTPSTKIEKEFSEKFSRQQQEKVVQIVCTQLKQIDAIFIKENRFGERWQRSAVSILSTCDGNGCRCAFGVFLSTIPALR